MIMHFLHHFKLHLLKKALLLLLPLFVFAVNFSVPSLAAQVLKTNENPSVTVLCYHHIIPEALPESLNTIVTLSEFEDQMKYLYEHGYYTASLKDIQEFLYNKQKLPEKTVVITFDDGYESNYIYAYQVLKKYDLKAVIFIIGSKMVDDGQAQDPNAIDKLSFDQIKEMAGSGLVEFGNHTFDAHDFINGQPYLLSMDQDGVLLDFEQVNNVFNKIGLSNPISIAYPFGKFNDAWVTAAKVYDYKLGFTVNKGFVYQDSPPMNLNRIIVPPDTTPEKFRALLQDDSPALPEGFEESIMLRIGSDTAYVFGKPLLLESAPIIVNGVAMTPLDFFKEQLGCDVIWDPILYQVATRVGYEDISWFSLTAYPVDGKVMVPVKPLAEVMGYEVQWHQEEKMVELKKP
jgi:peptidoglycan/xylan/chitin deacetylase (PgdA/CDA1 family)